MFALLLSPIGRWLSGGAIVLMLLGSGYLYVNHLQNKVQALETENHFLKKAKEIYEKDLQIDKNVATARDRIDALPPDNLDTEYKRLRDYNAGKGSKPGKATN